MEKSEKMSSCRPQKEIIYNKHLPYADKLDSEAEEYLAAIKFHLGIAITRKLIIPEGVFWIDHLAKYIKLYGHKFSKEDHCHFIHLLLEVIIIPDLALHCVQRVASVLTILLKKIELLSRDDLVIDWRVLYELFERTVFSPFEATGLLQPPNNFDATLKSLIAVARPYFSVESTQEMLDKWRPKLCPFDTEMCQGIVCCELFLCTKLPPHQHDRGWKLWLDDFIKLWDSNQNCPSWENPCVGLFARVARDNIGYIDWEPYIPMVFNRLLRSFNLPCSGNSLFVSQYSVEASSAVGWIVSMMGGGSSCQLYIDNLFKSLESYYHPSNNGRWMSKLHRLLHRFPLALVKRLNKERYRIPTWETPIPTKNHLTDEEVSQFVNCMIPSILLAMFSKGGATWPSSGLHYLALLKPETVIPPLIERLYSSLETVIEPHRLIAAIHCLITVTRSMVQKNPNFPEGQTHVLPLLMGSLPGIDPNDIKKCMVTFYFISNIATLVTFADCSKGNPDLSGLSEVERDLVLSTAAFEDFVLLFMDRCFSLIENSCFSHPSRVDRNFQNLNTEETIVEGCLSGSLRAVLSHCSKEIFQSALKKLFGFVSSHIFEIKIAGKNAANMCRMAAWVNPELSLPQFVPHFARKVLSLTESEEVAQEESLDNELLFSLQILSEVIRCNGVYVLKHVKEIESVLDRTLHLKCRDGYNLACSLLCGTLKFLSLTYSDDRHFIPNFWERTESPDAYKIVGEWGKPANINKHKIKYHIPSDEELEAAQYLLEKFLLPELKCLQEWASGGDNLSRKDVQRSLTIVYSCLTGAAGVLPLWDSPPFPLNDSPVPMHCCFVKGGISTEVKTKDGKNIRKLILEVIQQVLDHMLKTSEDATKSLLIIISIFNHLAFLWGISKEEFDTKWKSFHLFKKQLENQLYGNKQHVRVILSDRTCLQHEMRVMEKNKYWFTQEHCVIMQELTKLSVSHYFDVRSKAQNVLHEFLMNYGESYKVILPDLLRSLQKDPMQFHEEFKGALYLTVAYKHKSLMVIRSWDLWYQLWPALISAKHSEKPSIIKLLDGALANAQKHLDTVEIEYEVPESCCLQAKKLWHGSHPLPSGSFLTEEEFSVADELHKKRNHIRKEAYLSLVHKMLELIESGTLHWRSYRLAISMLAMLIRYDIKLPAPAVKLFVTHLVHDTLAVRKVAILAVCAILKQQKRDHPEVEIDPCSPELITDNPVLKSLSKSSPTSMWMQYNSFSAPKDQETWNKKIFVHKTHFGFSCWPRPFTVYAPDSEQPKLDRTREELSEEERAIYDSFIQEEFVEKLIEYFCIEEKKGQDKFDDKKFEMFKGLFRNFGDTFLPHLIKHLKRLAQDSQESHQRCAAEIIAGLIRGSKHWNFEMMMNLKEQMVPILDTVLQNVTPETLTDWNICLSNALECRDPNKYYWLYEFLMEKPVQQESGSFLESSWMNFLVSALYQQEWRVCELLHRSLEYLMPRLNHSYHIVRKTIGSILSNILMFDAPLPYEILEFAPKRSEFLAYVLPRIQILESDLNNESHSTPDGISDEEQIKNNLCDHSSKKKDATNLFHTVCRWIITNVSRTHYPAPPELFQLIPVLCNMQSDTSDSALHREYTTTFVALSRALLPPATIQAAMNSFKEVEKKGTWHSRVSALSYIQQMVFSNLFTVKHCEPMLEDIKAYVFRHLHDERVEVRDAAADTLGSLIHYAVIPVTNNFLSVFKRKCSTKLKKLTPVPSNDVNVCSVPVDPEALKERHAGILGLCACVNAYPYDVPDFMPDILMILGDHLHDPQPIQATIKKSLSNFRRTHHDSWRDHKLKFTDDQLAVITELLVSPNYYA